MWYVTYTNTGSVGATLPDPSTLSDPTKAIFEIWDAGSAGTNNITINTAGGNIDGATSFVIEDDKSGAKFFNDGTNWFSTANTARVASSVTSGNTLSAILAAGNTTGTNDLEVDSGQAIKFANSGFTASIAEPTLAADVTLTLPATTGTLALTANVLALAGGTMTGDIDLAAGVNLVLNNSTYTGTIQSATLTGNKVYTMPDATGTVALTSGLTADYFPIFNSSGQLVNSSTLMRESSGSISVGTTTGGAAHKMYVTQAGTSGFVQGLTAVSQGATSTQGVGVKGIGINSTARNVGVQGVGGASASPLAPTSSAVGVHGYANDASNDNYGGYFDATTSSSGDNYGVAIKTTNAGAGNHYPLRLIYGFAGVNFDVTNVTADRTFTIGNRDLDFTTAATYTPTNVVTDRSYDADTVAIAELADIVGTLIADLQSIGILS
jgi:hypothetical protein